MTKADSMFPRVRFTTHLPLDGTRIGLVVWFGSIPRGWVGKHVNPLKWNRTWRVNHSLSDMKQRSLLDEAPVACLFRLRHESPAHRKAARRAIEDTKISVRLFGRAE